MKYLERRIAARTPVKMLCLVPGTVKHDNFRYIYADKDELRREINSILKVFQSN